ncbi:hypothetical protein AMATHDRAFT_7977 [Amanita thiersii Skay4041]|uniref:Plasma-membrane choline transporter-domain-containing protein n=1 Tax=Amanita thiersii Skay4041 TaxID=703135 RepID=A0A2A9NEX7_9AGAR|nr:hypothetical protein AMATHDRAFT_7977 [Amanita thiersii Skay4041]
MATSFAAYASQFLNRQTMSSSQTSGQPMFFSFTTEEGSHVGHNPDTDLDDLDDPHLRPTNPPRGSAQSNRPEDDDDPYLRLDEDEHIGRASHDSRTYYPQSVPLIASETRSESPESPRGWLAHLAHPMRLARSPSPAPSTDSTDSEPPHDLLVPGPSRAQQSPPPAPPANHEPQSLSLTESLLPRDGRVRPLDVFSLPDPRHTPRSRRKYNDSIWTVIWLTGVTLCVFFSILLLFLTRKPAKKPRLTLPYTTLLHTVPLLTILTFLSAAFAYMHIYLLRIFVRPVMIATSFFVPVTLFISALWAFIGSFMWDGDTEPTWGETVGLRLFSLIPLALSIITARRLVHLPETLHVASSTLTLTTHLLISNHFLLALSPAILLLTLIASIPFLTLIFRLLLIGYPMQPSADSPAWEWHVYAWANWAIVGSVTVWLWSWGVARGVLRMTCASVIGSWYFSDPDTTPLPPSSTHTIHAAIIRSTGPSIGTIALSALLLTIIRMLTILAALLHRLPAYIPARIFFVATGVRMVINYLETVTTALSKYALVYSGLTGDPFMHSARRAKALTTTVEGKVGRYGRRKISTEPPLVLLTIAPLTMTLPSALLTYLFVAHTLNAPDQALGAAVLAGGVTALVGLFCVGLVKDTADTLYICYCIDKETNERRREEVFILFEYNQPQRQANLPAQPQRIIPLPPRRATPQQQRAAKDRNQHQIASNPIPVNRAEAMNLAPSSMAASASSQLTQRPVPLSPSAAVTARTIRPPVTLVIAPPLASSPVPQHFTGLEGDSETEDDINPFQHSYRKGEPLPTVSSPPISHHHHRRHSEEQQQAKGAKDRMLTSRELNMKSIYREGKTPRDEISDDSSDSDSDSERVISAIAAAAAGDERGDGDDDDGSSQFYPGSGFL